MKTILKSIMTVVFVALLALQFTAVDASAASTPPVKLKIGNQTFKGVFYQNDTAKALLKTLPKKYKMSDLNGNEKYKYLNKDLPTNEKAVKKIKAGDIMLYGSDCLVVFYKSFTTSYEYTRVGRITNTKGLKKAVGKGSVTIQFSKRKVIKLTHKTLTLKPGQSKTIKLKGASAKKVRWSTSNSKVATVSKGKIKAKKAGKATITAKYKGKKYKCKVTVRAAQKAATSPTTEPGQVTPEPVNPDPTNPDSTDSVNPDPANPVNPDPTDPVNPDPANPVNPDPTDPVNPDQPEAEKELTMKIGDQKVNVQWEDNESVAALKELVREQPLTIQMSMYGGFEQVGSIGTSLPRNDAQTTTSAGDIVLYSGNQIVVFYGSNSWAYTRLGHITDQDSAGMAQLLGNGNVTITISFEELSD